MSYISYGSSIELAAGWQLTVANSKFSIEIELAASCQLTVANSFHIYLMIASSNWQLASGWQLPIHFVYTLWYLHGIGSWLPVDSCQFKVLDWIRIGSQLPVDSCQFISYISYGSFIELAAGWQLTVANSKFLIEIELAASCQLPVANSLHISLMVALSNWQLAYSWQLPIQSSW